MNDIVDLAKIHGTIPLEHLFKAVNAKLREHFVTDLESFKEQIRNWTVEKM